MSENLGSIEYTVDANVDPLLTANKDAEKSLDKIEKSMDEAGKASDKLDTKLKKVSVSVSSVVDVMKTAATVSSALAAALGVISSKSAASAREIQQMAGLSGVAVERFQELAFASKSVGFSGEKLGDVFKDVQDKIGDFIATGGGELADYFENVAPLVGQTAEQFKNLSGPDALILFKKGLDAANLSASEQIFYLESLANDASILSPLLAENGKGFNEAANRARELNVVLSEFQIDQLLEVDKAFNELKSTFGSATDAIVADNAPAIIKAVTGASDAIVSFSDFVRENIEAIKVLGVSLGVATAAFYTYRIAVNAAAIATTAANIAMRANPIGILVTSLGAAAGAMYAYSEGADNAADSTRYLKEQTIGLSKAEKERFVNDLKQRAINKQLELNEAIKEEQRIREKTSDSMSGGGLLGGVGTSAELLAAQAKVAGLKNEYDSLVKSIVAAKEETNTLIEITGRKNEVGQQVPLMPDKGNIPNIFDTEQGAFGMTDESGVSAYNQSLQETLGITQQLADQLESLDQKFQNIASTIGGTLYEATMSWSDASGQAIAQNIADGDRWNEGLNEVARTIGTQLLGSLISLGIQYGINSALKAAADTKEAASGTASLAAVTTAGVTAAGTLASAWAPAAAGAAVATSGGAATAGGAALTSAYGTAQALSVAGGRLNGGPVGAGKLYEVNEDGRPEMLTVGGKQMLMMGNQSGTVTSNKDMMAASGGNVSVVVNNNASGAEASATSRQQDGKTIIEVVVADIKSRGQVHKAITSTTTANNKV